MRDGFEVKPGMGVLLNYFSANLPNFISLRKSALWNDMKKICKNGEATFETFYLFGAFDILNLGISADVKKLDDMQKIKSHQRIKGVIDYFMHYGLIASVYPQPFNFNKAVTQNPLIGIITIKIRGSAWDILYDKITNINALKQKIGNLFISAINKTKTECPKLASQDYKALLLLSYNCEDAIIITFTNSFQFTKQLTTNVRTLELSDFFKNLSSNRLKHIIASTHTILGLQLAIKNKQLAVPAPTIVNNNCYDKLNWLTYLEVRPGHLQNAIGKIRSNFKRKKLNLRVEPLAGRNDLIIYPVKVKHSISTFLDLHYNIINCVALNKSFESSETYISFPTLDRVESKKEPERVFSDATLLIQELNKTIKKIEHINSPLHILEKESFIQIIRKLKYLLDNRHLQDSFLTLFPVIRRAINEYCKPNVTRSGKSIDILTGFFELCFATRFQGSPSVGETAVYPTLGYYSMGQKVLVLLDYLGNWILTTLAKKLIHKKFNPHYIATITMNCPSGVCVPMSDIYISFIFLPPRPLFHPEILFETFSHELGHVIFNCIINSIEATKNLDEADKCQLRKSSEIFAEFISAKILTDLNFNDYKKLINNCLDAFKFKGARNNTIYDDKNEFILKAEKFHRIVHESNKRSHNKAVITLSRQLKIKNRSVSEQILEYLKFIRDWQEDDVIRSVRKFLSSKDKQTEFWNLWILLYSLRGDCYYNFNE